MIFGRISRQCWRKNWIHTLEKVTNAFGEDGGIVILSEEADFSGREREGHVNKESAEIS